MLRALFEGPVLDRLAIGVTHLDKLVVGTRRKEPGLFAMGRREHLVVVGEPVDEPSPLPEVGLSRCVKSILELTEEGNKHF